LKNKTRDSVFLKTLLKFIYTANYEQLIQKMQINALFLLIPTFKALKWTFFKVHFEKKNLKK